MEDVIMNTALRSAGLFALLLTGGTVAAQAQTHRSHFGPRVSYDFDAEVTGLGVQLGLPVAHHLEFYPSFDVFLVDRGSSLGINADLKYRIGRADLSWLYVGTGLHIAHRSINSVSNNDSRLNLFTGVESLRGRVHPFGELRLMLGNGSSAQLAGGLNFTM
jgi:hypothetical protein